MPGLSTSTDIPARLERIGRRNMVTGTAMGGIGAPWLLGLLIGSGAAWAIAGVIWPRGC